MRLTPGLHLVLSGDAGVSLSHPLDCSCYAFETNDGAVLFDCGSGADAEGTRAALRTLDAPVTYVFLTHAHADHAGGGAIVKVATSAKFHAGAATRRIVETSDTKAMSLDDAKRAGVYPDDFTFSPFAIDETCVEGRAVTIGGARIDPIETPGHCADHMSYLVSWNGKRALIAGDALFAGGSVTLQNIWDCSVPQTCATIATLAALEFDVFLPAHGAFSLANGRRHAQMARDRVDRLLVPSLFA